MDLRPDRVGRAPGATATHLATLNAKLFEWDEARGENRFVELEGAFGPRRGTLTWDAEVLEVRPPASGADGVVRVGGALGFRGDYGTTCTGRWSSG